MTCLSDGVPFGSVAAYRPGRPRSGDTVMTRQGWELVMDLKFSDPERIRNIASWMASDHGRDLFPSYFGCDRARSDARSCPPGERRQTAVNDRRACAVHGGGRARKTKRVASPAAKGAEVPWIEGIQKAGLEESHFRWDQTCSAKRLTSLSGSPRKRKVSKRRW